MFFYTNVETTFNDIIVSGVHNNKRFIKKAEFNPCLYIEDNNGKYKSIYGDKLKKIEFDNISDFFKFKSQHKDTGLNIYGDIAPQYQFINKHFNGDIEFNIDLVNIVYYDIEVSSLTKEDRYYGFPHAEEAPIPIVSIAFYSSLTKKMMSFGLKDYDVRKTLFPHIDITYHKCSCEKQLLRCIFAYLTDKQTRPDVLYGWNSDHFDLPYIFNRIKKVLGEKSVNNLSPFGNTYTKNAMRRVFGQNEPYLKYHITGIPHLDMIDVYRKFSGLNCSFSMALNNIANRDLKEGKLDYGASRNLMELYFDNFQHYQDYNNKDTFLLHGIDEYRSLSEKIITAALKNKCNMVDTLGTTKQWETILYNEYDKLGFIVPYKQEYDKLDYAGGYVRDSIIGVKTWNMTLDFKSLYPNILIGMNMSPETLSYQHTDGCCVAPNNVFFTTDKQGVLAGTSERGFIQRKEYQKLMNKYDNENNKFLKNKYDSLQYIEKINLNSLYGGCANRHFLFFKPEIAKSITSIGQYAIKEIANRLNLVMNRLCDTVDQVFFDGELPNLLDISDDEYEDYIVMGDTDSCAISFELYVNKYMKGKTDKEILDKILYLYQEELIPEINQCLDEIQSKFNFYKKTLILNLETITRKSIFLQKKRYLGHIVWDEGKELLDYDNPEFKIKGVEGIKSSTSGYFQNKFMEFYKLCLLSDNKDEIRNYIKEVEQDYKKQYVVESGKPVKIKNLTKYACDKKIYKIRTPEATKGSLLYNHYIKKFGLEKKYNLLMEGDYGKLLKLKKDNGFVNINNKGYIVPETVICVPEDDVLPPELELEEHVDYKLQFDKFFKNPCLDIMKIMKINPIKIGGNR